MDVILKWERHLFSNNVPTGIILNAAFLFSVLPYVSKIPFIGSIIKVPSNLLKGYMTEKAYLDSGNSQKLEIIHNPKIKNNANDSEVYDYIVIGSGPGAAIAFDKLYQENKTFCIIEKGKISTTPQSLMHTIEHVRSDFQSHGQEFILSNQINMYAQANVLGGGSEVNSGLYHRIPGKIKDEFLLQLGITSSEWEVNERYIESILCLSINNVSEMDSVIVRGSKSIGLKYENIPRWRTYKADSLFTQHGMRNIVWDKYYNYNNVRFVLESKVNKIVNKSSQYLEVISENKSGKLVLKGRQVILAAGTISSPKILIKSNLIKPSSTSFQWHPMHRIIVETKETDLGLLDIDPYQSWTQERDLKFGSSVSTPGMLSLTIGQKLNPLDWTKLRSYYFSYVSNGLGHFKSNLTFPIYKFSEQDYRLQLKGSDLLNRLVLNAGTKLVHPINQKSKATTVHIFGSLPTTNNLYVAKSIRLKSEPRIQVADGSILPFGPGVNPQGIIMTAVRSLVAQ